MKSGWTEKPLGEVIRLEYGKPLDNKDRKSNGLYPVAVFWSVLSHIVVPAPKT